LTLRILLPYPTLFRSGFKKRSQAAGGGDAGIGDLIGMLGGLGGSGLVESVIGPQATDVSRGNDVLGQIFGSKDVSRQVAGQASRSEEHTSELQSREKL